MRHAHLSSCLVGSFDKIPRSNLAPARMKPGRDDPVRLFTILTGQRDRFFCDGTATSSGRGKA
jgi:hypothetical protein